MEAYFRSYVLVPKGISSTLLLGGAAIAGYVIYASLPISKASVTNAVAAGAILVMLVDTMIPEAYQRTRDYAGLATMLGFIVAFVLSHGGG